MYRVLTADQTRHLEQEAVARGVTLYELMSAAGTAVADVVMERFPEGDVVVVAGPGGNGGDGWVAARMLHDVGRGVIVLTQIDPQLLRGEAARAAREAIQAGVKWKMAAASVLAELLSSAGVVVDALLGIGGRPELDASLASLCDTINASEVAVVAADVPTGLHADTGHADECAIEADVTVTFSHLKPGLVVGEGVDLAGDVVIADVGAPDPSEESSPALEVPSPAEYAAMLPRHAFDAHKNQRGRLLIVAGSRGFPGAAVLAARGAQRMGAGYVTLAVPHPIARIVQSHLASVPVVGLPAGKMGAFSFQASAALFELASEHAAVVVGPGLTLADGVVGIVRSLTAEMELPLVLDADGLNAFVDAAHLLERRRAPLVITPHPGELSRLLDRDTASIQADRVSSSRVLASSGRVVVLKGAGTLISDGDRTVLNTSGSWALASAGSGDVLAGMVGSLLAQGVAPFEAGVLAAWLHGRAGDFSAAVLTPWCVTADDIPEHLPAAVGELI